MNLPDFYIEQIIKDAILEDINYIDVTTDHLIPDDSVSEAKFIAKDTGVIAGVNIAARVFEMLDKSIQYNIIKSDGHKVCDGEVILTLKGNTKSLLKGERTALNLIQHLSGIASMTNRCVDLVKGTNASIADTRKTLPGLRRLQKYAVIMGGGKNHRYNLSDAAMLKDNHIDAYGSITHAVNALRTKIGHTIKIEVEVSTFEQLNEAITAGADVIMLDNMSIEQMAQAVKITDKRALLEASGNITEQNIKQVAETGVDIISLGAITHSVKAFDISMKIQL